MIPSKYLYFTIHLPHRVRSHFYKQNIFRSTNEMLKVKYSNLYNQKEYSLRNPFHEVSINIIC
jgi:hypothetical protein